MTSRNEVRIDIEVEGGTKAERQFNRAEKGARGLGRSTRGLINPLIGAGLVSGILGGGLLSLALSSGSASNSLIRIQGSLEGLVGTITRKLEPAIDFAAGQFEKLPIGAQLGVLASAAVLGVVFVKLIGAAAGGIAAAVTALAAKAIAAPLLAGVLNAAKFAIFALQYYAVGLVAGVSAAVALAVTAVVVSIAALALIAWDLIFNDGALLRRFEDWLLGFGWIKAIDEWSKGIDPAFAKAWDTAVGFFTTNFAGPLATAWETVRDFFLEDFTAFFTQTIPEVFKGAWDAIIGFFDEHFSVPLLRAWFGISGFFLEDFTGFFTETIPGIFKGGWDSVIGFFYGVFARPFVVAWARIKGFFLEDFTGFFTETIPGIFKGGWDSVIGFFYGVFARPFVVAWARIKGFFLEDFTAFFTETIPGVFKSGWEDVVGLFEGFANDIIGVLQSLVDSFGKLPIPRVSVGVAYRSFGPLRVPYPTFSVGTRPLSSYIGLPQIPTIPTPSADPRQQTPSFRGGSSGGPGTNGPIVNYYSLASTDFAREVERLINAPGAQARAVGAP